MPTTQNSQVDPSSLALLSIDPLQDSASLRVLTSAAGGMCPTRSLFWRHPLPLALRDDPGHQSSVAAHTVVAEQFAVFTTEYGTTVHTGVVSTPAETGVALNEIAFEIVTHGSGAREVVPLVDGNRLRDIVARFEEAAGFSTPGSYAGIVPDHFRFGPLADHFMGNGDWNHGAPAVLGCDCLEWGCWPFHAVIEMTSDRVRWTSFLGPKKDRNYSGLGPFEFDRARYEAAVAELATALEQSDG